MTDGIFLGKESLNGFTVSRWSWSRVGVMLARHVQSYMRANKALIPVRIEV